MSFVGSLRVRLTAAFFALAAAAITMAAVAITLWVEEATLGALDAALLQEATTISKLTDLPRERLAAAVQEIGDERDLGPGKFISVIGVKGEELSGFRRMPKKVSQRRPREVTHPIVMRAGEDDAMFRVAWAPIAKGGIVAVGIHATSEVRWVQRTRWGIALLGATCLLVLSTGAWLITGRATRELDRLAEEVGTIEAGSLSRRLSHRRTEEVERLVVVLNRLFERLERSVVQLRRFTADAAHELRTPLAALRARMEIALDRGDGAVSRDAVFDAIEQVERLGRLAEDLLMLARVEGGAVAQTVLEGRVDLSHLIDEIGSTLAAVAEEQGRPFHWSTPPGLLVRGSEPLVKRMLVNLVDNAFRHTPPTASVEIVARREGTHVAMEVRDAGPGVDPAILPHAFDRFRHTSGTGSGLGLALVREIVERHRGTVRLETAPGGGTIARVSLVIDGSDA